MSCTLPGLVRTFAQRDSSQFLQLVKDTSRAINDPAAVAAEMETIRVATDTIRVATDNIARIVERDVKDNPSQ